MDGLVIMGYDRGYVRVAKAAFAIASLRRTVLSGVPQKEGSDIAQVG